MKLYIITFLMWGFINGACAIGAAGAIKKMASDVVHLNCRIFDSLVVWFPIKEPQIEKVGFQLRTPCNASIKVPMTNAGSLKNLPEFDVTKQTIVFVTGWITPLDKDYIQEVAKSFHCRGQHNFVVFDSGGFIMNEYFNSAHHTKRLGEFLAVGLAALAPYDNIYLVGHSLGSQIVGSAGRHYRTLTGKNLKRITGLDPARPCFINPLVFPRLGPSDGDFVDIIHSNPFDLGTEEVVGHVDFFVEGLDVIKPGCSSISLRCSHEISIQYYLESVYPGNEHNFIGTHCNNYMAMENKQCNGSKATMGYMANSSSKGIYYVSVNSKSPYGLNAADKSDFLNNKCGRCS